jgi:hypothetical protein
VVATQAEGKAGEVGTLFWAAAGREAHRDGSSTVVCNGQRGSPMVGHKRGEGRRLMARGGAPVWGGARGGVSGPDGASE